MKCLCLTTQKSNGSTKREAEFPIVLIIILESLNFVSCPHALTCMCITHNVLILYIQSITLLNET